MALTSDDLTEHPMELFEIWYQEAESSDVVNQPNAMCISTIDDNGFPDSRYVLLKDYNSESLVFYTNLESAKGRQLLNNDKIAVNFYWKPLSRQVRMQGQVHQVKDEIADAYFATRTRGSQIGAWTSKQSQELESREILEQRYNRYREKFEGVDIPRPDFWSGFRIIPSKIEFWESGENRLHDRFEYNFIGTEWEVKRLYP